MKFNTFNKGGEFRVAFFSRETFGNILLSDKNILKIAQVNDFEIHLLSLGEDFSEVMRGLPLDQSRLFHNEEVGNLYDYIFQYMNENSIKISIFFGSGFLWVEDFLEKIKCISYVACYFADDPEGSEDTSRYYVKNFHYAFCGGVFFNKTERIEEKYIEWGARKAKFIPLGAYPAKYNEPIKGLDKRHIDLVYVGGCYFPKVFRMFRLKWHFGNRMKMYGRGWNYSNSKAKTLILKLLKLIFRIPDIEELPQNKLVELYQNSKIGFNIHMSYGPSNLRLYELPMNGVMQICDCKYGLGELYEIGKEVVVYETISEAIKKIEYYLKHDEERIKIAKAGYLRAKNNYLLEHSFQLIKTEILSDIKKNYSTRYLV